MSRFAINPPDEDRDAVNPEHEADQRRQEQWDLFIAAIRDVTAAQHWRVVLFELGQQAIGRASSPVADEIQYFADSYGWPDTLRAIAQAMQADEIAKTEAMDRR